MENVELILIILKYCSIVVGTFFGIFALILDFKDNEGKITVAGKRALIIISCAGIISVSVQSIELILIKKNRQNETKKTLEEIRVNNKILNDINKTLHPIDNLKITVLIKFPEKNQYLKKYFNRLDTSFNSFKKNIKSYSTETLNREYGIMIPWKDEFGDYDETYFLEESEFLPDKIKEKTTYNLLFHNELNIMIRKDKLPLDSITNNSFTDIEGDILMNYYVGIPPYDRHNISKGNYYFSLDSLDGFGLIGEDIKPDIRYLRNNGKIISVNDLLGSQMLVQLSNFKDDHNLVKEYKLDVLVLKVSSGRAFWIHEKSFYHSKDLNGTPVYIFNFPDEYSELEKYYDM